MITLQTETLLICKNWHLKIKIYNNEKNNIRTIS